MCVVASFLLIFGWFVPTAPSWSSCRHCVCSTGTWRPCDCWLGRLRPEGRRGGWARASGSAPLASCCTSPRSMDVRTLLESVLSVCVSRVCACVCRMVGGGGGLVGREGDAQAGALYRNHFCRLYTCLVVSLWPTVVHYLILVFFFPRRSHTRGASFGVVTTRFIFFVLFYLSTSFFFFFFLIS